jgi:XTP/dITP diphosphohydrolase
MKLVLATNNEDKIRAIKNILGDLGIEIMTCQDFDDFPKVEETGKTLKENAILKAQAIHKATGLPALADDSGLEVDYLHGEPGLFSSRYAGPGCTYDDNNNKLLRKMQSVPKERRKAMFRCVIAICFGEGDTSTVEGTVDGYIAVAKSTSRGGFGYDPVFFYPSLGKTFAELSLEEKNKISHRGLALAKAKEVLAKRST